MLTDRVLNRTLLQRQHLLERAGMAPLAMVEQLLGLQAQDVLPPYVSLFARLSDFRPSALSQALESRSAVRLVAMRGTLHLLTPDDALTLRPWTQPQLTRTIARADWGRGFPVDRYAGLAQRTRWLLADGPLPVKKLGEGLAEHYPDHSPSDCGNLARTLVPLVQLPPRGLWKQRGGQVYDTIERWCGSPLREPDAAGIVRRYLRAYGPATPADVTAWSGVTGMRAVFEALGDELVVHKDESGRDIWDLAGLSLATGEEPAPVRLLGTYDNVWLSHARRDRVTAPENRRRWMGTKGGVGATVFVDGLLEGVWRQTGSGAIDVDLFRALTAVERAELDEEVAALQSFLDS